MQLEVTHDNRMDIGCSHLALARPLRRIIRRLAFLVDMIELVEHKVGVLVARLDVVGGARGHLD